MESYGILALLPAAIVIILALVTKKTHLSLCIGIFIGVIILCGGNPLTAFPVMFRDYIIPPLTSEGQGQTLPSDRLHILIFLFHSTLFQVYVP